jgi:hypothetical protein
VVFFQRTEAAHGGRPRLAWGGGWGPFWFSSQLALRSESFIPIGIREAHEPTAMPSSKCTRATTPKSASLLFNNLTTNGKHAAYVSYTSAVVVPESHLLSGSSAASHAVTIDEPDGAQIQQVRWLPFAAGELFAVGSQRSLQIYTPDAQRLLHVVTAPEENSDGPGSFRGLGSCATGGSEYVCAGVSTGAVCLVPVGTDLGNFGAPLLSPASQHPIVDLSAGPAPHNDPSRALVCTADGNGDVNVHALETDGGWGHCTSFSVVTHDGTPPLCTSLRLRGALLYCAYATGHVRIYDLVSCSLCVQIAAHARWINALEVHPNGATFVTASEDCTIGVWAFHDGKVCAFGQ